ncbi:ABC transporter ATP-binding protein [Alicyclobacillus fastidiosus]|nr:multidrug ABC transporter ATP-binding protein [Alicyclobacillus fastidiosus]
MAKPAAEVNAGPRPNPFQMGMGHGPGRGPIVKVRAKDTKTTVRRIWGYLRQQRLGLIAVLVSTAISTGLSLLAPYLLGRAVDLYIVPRNATGLWQMCLILLAVYGCGVLFTWIQQFVMAGVSQRTVRAMRHDLFVKFQTLPLRYFDTRTHGELMSRTTNDISNVSNTLNQSVIQLISSALMLVGSVVMMLSQNLWMTIVTIVTIPLITTITKRITTYTRKYFSYQQKNLGEVNGFVEETITGQRVIKVFHREEKALQEFRTINDRLRKVGVRAQSLSGSMGPLMNATGNLNFAVIAVAGGLMAFHHMITIGVIVSFLNYSRQFSQPINQLANQYNMVQSAVAGAERVFEVLDEPSEYEDESGQLHVDTHSDFRVVGDVKLQDVNFGYVDGVPVLKNVSLHAKSGETIALVGPTGAGKTTIVNLLTRFYEIQSGTITIDDVDIRTLDKQVLRSQLGIVLQDAYLFSGTIRENIRFGRLGATDADVETAATLANADAFIRKLPQGYDTPLTAEGSNLSHGQRQLITIARAILADPGILILDEATSSVDTRTELHIQEAMYRLMQGRTSFVVAHRLSTIRNADQILVIHGGEIVERGTHDELLEQRGFYHGLYMSQFARFA